MTVKAKPRFGDTERAIAPKLAELTEHVLYGDVWERPTLSKRDRSLITLAALVGMYRIEQIGMHVERAIENGVSRDEIGEMLTHLAFYAGWPASVSAAGIANKVLTRLEAEKA
jgi:4-carboxymuconolactone decarboxylase